MVFPEGLCTRETMRFAQMNMKMAGVAMLMLTLGSCGSGHTPDNGFVLRIDNIEQDQQQLTITSAIENNSGSAVWVCESMDSTIPLQCEVGIDDASKLARVTQASFKIPADVFLEEPVWAKYVKLEKEGIFTGKTNLVLPLREADPIDPDRGSSDALKSITVEKLVFEIGIVTEDLSRLKGTACRGNSSDEVAYVSCFWIEENPEQIISQTIENVSIPCTAPE